MDFTFETSGKNAIVFRRVFRTKSNIYDRTFSAKIGFKPLKLLSISAKTFHRRCSTAF